MMRTIKFATLLALAWINGSLLAQDIIFTNRTATFTNLQGALYKDATLIKADLDGLMWRSGASGGRICYTNLNPMLLKELGVPIERVEIAKLRAGHKAVSDAQYHAALGAQVQLELLNKKQDQLARLEARVAEEKDAPRKAALEEINNLEADIEARESQINRADAVTPVGASGDPAYVNAVMAQRAQVNLAAVDLIQAKKRLAKMKQDYADKYSK
jgi:uncharacterized protein YjbI with pentapeptide repeats